jgi:uncharacterized protein
MASDITPSIPSTPLGEAAPASPRRNDAFYGPRGLRAGWRIAIYFAIVVGLAIVLFGMIAFIPALRELLRAQAANAQSGVITPLAALLNEGALAVVVVAAAGFMTLIDKRSFANYGLPWNEAFGKSFWQGIGLGFVMLSLLLAGIWVLHGFSLEGLAVSGGTAVKYGLEWAIVFFFVAVFEDFTFRGYLQSALADGIGFWWAAIVWAIVFGGIHYNNHGEALFGCAMAGSFGLLEAFALSRVGSLWLLFGMHASWDWGETYFYGTPDSGALGLGHLFNSSFHGARWLTGGTVGPEGSWLVFVVLIVWALVIHFLFPAKRANAST